MRSVDIDEGNEAAYRFTTYKNYIANFRNFLFETYGEGKPMLCKLKSTLENIGIAGIQRKNLDNTKLQTATKLLYNAWHTELMLILSGQYKEYVRYSNHWSSVQAYYAVFLALQALFESARMQRQNTHSYTLTTVSNLIKQRKMFPLPWCVYCTGSPDLKEEKYFNLPNDVDISRISPLSAPGPTRFWNSYGMLLRTTREKQCAQRADAWKRQKENYTRGKPRKKLSKDCKRQIYEQVHATTFFDVLYRLRIRSNYQDADSYLLGTLSDYDARLIIIQ